MPFLYHFVRYWLPVCLLCAGIFIQSSYAVPNLGRDWFFLNWPHLDKMVHGLLYGLLSLLIARAFYSLPRWQDRRIQAATAGMVLSTLYGLTDEWHQSFVIIRTADSADLLADFIGSVAGALVFIGLATYLRARTKRNGAAGFRPVSSE